MKTPKPNKKPAKAKPATKTIKVVQHAASHLTMAKADKVVEGVFNNDPLGKIAAAVGMSEGAAFKLVHNVKVPADYPTNQEEWQEQTKQFLQIAIWKGTRKLAMEMDDIDVDRLSVATAICVDKLALMSGQATSVALHLSATLNPGAVLDRLKSAATAKPTDSVVVDDKKPQ